MYCDVITCIVMYGTVMYCHVRDRPPNVSIVCEGVSWHTHIRDRPPILGILTEDDDT